MRRRSSGQRNQLIQIQTDVPTTNNDGQSIPDWDSIAAVPEWASITPRGAGEPRRFEQLRPEIDHLVVVLNNNFTRTVKANTHRVLWGDRILNIESVIDPTSRNEEMELRCIEVQK